MIVTTTATGPSHWASYLINGDATGFDYYNTPDNPVGDRDKADCDAWVERLAAEGWCIVSTEDEESFFTWYCDAFAGRRYGVDACTYILHKQVSE